MLKEEKPGSLLSREFGMNSRIKALFLLHRLFVLFHSPSAEAAVTLWCYLNLRDRNKFNCLLQIKFIFILK